MRPAWRRFRVVGGLNRARFSRQNAEGRGRLQVPHAARAAGIRTRPLPSRLSSVATESFVVRRPGQRRASGTAAAGPAHPCTPSWSESAPQGVSTFAVRQGQSCSLTQPSLWKTSRRLASTAGLCVPTCTLLTFRSRSTEAEGSESAGSPQVLSAAYVAVNSRQGHPYFWFR